MTPQAKAAKLFNQKRKAAKKRMTKLMNDPTWIPQEGDMIYVGTHLTDGGRMLGGLAKVAMVKKTKGKDHMVTVHGRENFQYSWKDLRPRQWNLFVEFYCSKAMAALPPVTRDMLQTRRCDTFEMQLF